MAERSLNVTSIQNNFKSLMEQVYEKHAPIKLTKKESKYQLQSRFKSKVVETTYTERKNADWLLIIDVIYFFPKSKCYKSKLGKACMS